MKTLGEWGDNLTLISLSQALNVNIILLHIDGNEIPIPDPLNKDAVSLNIGFSGNHYWSLKKQPIPITVLANSLTQGINPSSPKMNDRSE